MRIRCLMILFSACLNSAAAEKNLSLKLYPDETFVYVGIGWRLIYQIDGQVDRTGIKLESRLVLDKFQTDERERSEESAGPWDIETTRKLHESLQECIKAREEHRPFESSEGPIRLSLTKDRFLSVSAGPADKPTVHAEIPGGEAKEFNNAIRPILEFLDALEGKPPVESAPDSEGFGMHIERVTTYTHEGSDRYSHVIDGELHTSGMELEGSFTLNPQRDRRKSRSTGGGDAASMRLFAESLKSLATARSQGKKFKPDDTVPRIIADKKDVIGIEVGNREKPFIKTEIPAADAEEYANGILSVVELAESFNRKLEQARKQNANPTSNKK